jgi:hypothetical protein
LARVVENNLYKKVYPFTATIYSCRTLDPIRLACYAAFIYYKGLKNECRRGGTNAKTKTISAQLIYGVTAR